MNARPTPFLDEELAALRAGKTSAACARIVERYGSLVKSACRRVLRDEGLAEDAAQETFVLLMKKAHGLPPATSLAGWLYHAAYRTALNHQRAAMRRRAREHSAEAMNQMTPDTQPNPWTEIEPHLDEAMLALPERQRNLVVQCYFQNQSQRSAAALLGCSESVVSRELSAAIEALRQFFAKRRITVGGVALGALLSSHGASAAMTGGATVVSAMMATTTGSTLLAALIQAKLLLMAAALVGTAAIATVGYQMASSGADRAGQNRAAAAASQGGAVTASSAAKRGKAGGEIDRTAWQGKWEADFQFTSAMALDERKKQVLLESDPDLRYALLRKMGVGLSREGFDALIARGLDASVAPWRDTFAVLANRTDMFDNYLMAWSNEEPLAALNWVAGQPDKGIGLRNHLLYVLEAKQFQPEALREWINSLTVKARQDDAMIALEWMVNPAAVVAQMGTGGNEGFLVDLAMLDGGARLDWSAFGHKLAAGKSAIVARVMRQILDGDFAPQQIEELIQALAPSPEAPIGVGAVAILRAAHGQPGVDYQKALALAEAGIQVGMSDFKPSIYQGWAVADPQAAMQYSGGLKNLAHLRDVIRGLTTLPDEATLLTWMAGSPTKAQDIALAAIYGRMTNGPFDQLQKIRQSTAILDQVEAAQEVMRMAALSDAPALSQWLKQLPAGVERQKIATALIRRLAAVDPQATLDLVQSEGLRGNEYERVVSNAVTQFTARNDLAKSTQFIQQITDPVRYAEALGQLAMVKFTGRPQEAFAYLQAHARGDWQPAALRMLTELYYNKLGNIDANAAEILKLDLPRLGPEVAQRAQILCKIWIDHQVPIAVPLAWTQQLPDTLGRETRLQLARNYDLKPTTLQQYQAWAKTAPITSAERTNLLTVLGNRLAAQVSR